MKPAGLRHRLEHSAFRLLHGAFRLLPHRLCRPLGGALGSAARVIDRQRRAVGLRNLEIALPDLDRPERRELVQRCYRNLGGSFADSLSVGRFDARQLCPRVSLEGWEHLEAAAASGRGVLLLTAHLGSWEVLGPVLASFKGPTEMVVRPSDNPLLERFVRRHRERLGNRSIYKRGAALKMFHSLKRGGRIIILIDQRVHPDEGLELPFFGRLTMTTPLPALLATRSGAPAVPLFCYPEPAGRFRVVAHPPIEPRGRGDEAVRELTARYLEAIESAIRARPEQWLWMHERWRIY